MFTSASNDDYASASLTWDTARRAHQKQDLSIRAAEHHPNFLDRSESPRPRQIISHEASHHLLVQPQPLLFTPVVGTGGSAIVHRCIVCRTRPVTRMEETGDFCEECWTAACKAVRRQSILYAAGSQRCMICESRLSAIMAEAGSFCDECWAGARQASRTARTTTETRLVSCERCGTRLTVRTEPAGRFCRDCWKYINEAIAQPRGASSIPVSSQPSAAEYEIAEDLRRRRHVSFSEPAITNCRSFEPDGSWDLCDIRRQQAGVIWEQSGKYCHLCWADGKNAEHLD